ncbi:MAG: hypothetical protein IKL89_03105 [Clostridia bacterium]|nr:hypothetical protein [Clostridia bacterium]
MKKKCQNPGCCEKPQDTSMPHPERPHSPTLDKTLTTPRNNASRRRNESKLSK